MFRSFRATRWKIFTRAVLPESLPQVFTGLRISLSQALVVVIVTEMFMGTKLGLGQRILNANLMYRIPEMYAAIIITGIIGYSINAGFAFFHGKVIHWTYAK
jgi:NitT/TauT family transport system permease protein